MLQSLANGLHKAKRRGTALAVVISWLWLGAVRAAEPVGAMLFLPVGSQDDIPGNIVTALLQDDRGFIWVGTQSGLMRYDGYEFLRFVHDPENSHSIGGNYVRTLWLADDGKVWAGTLSSGISVFDPATNGFYQYQHDPADPHSLPDNRVEAILGDDQGYVWVGTNRGLARLDPGTGRFARFQHQVDQPASLADNHVRDLLFDSKGNLLIAHWRGVDVLPPGSSEFRRFSARTADGETLTGKLTHELYLTRDGELWIGTSRHGAAWVDASGRLHFLPVEPSSPTALKHRWIQNFAQIDRDTLWIGTYGGGISIVDIRSKTVRQTIHWNVDAKDIGQRYIGDFLMDDSGLLWVGKWGAGLYRYNPDSRVFTLLKHRSGDPHGLSHGDVTAVMERANGDIWVANRAGQIDVLNSRLIRIDTLSSHAEGRRLFDGHAITMVEDSHQTVWIGTNNDGLVHFDPQTGETVRFATEQGLLEDSISRLLIDGENLWIGTDSGLNRLNLATRDITAFVSVADSAELANSRVTTLAGDDDGHLWIGTYRGLYLLSAGEQMLRHFNADRGPNSLSHQRIIDVEHDQQGRLWVSTAGGLDMLSAFDDSQANFISVNKRVGQPYGDLMGSLLRDANGNMWSIKGWIDGDATRFTSLARIDGIDVGTPWDTSFGQTRDGRMMFGGSDGLLVFNPSQVDSWGYRPPVQITHMRVDGAEVNKPIDNRVMLAPGARSINVYFSALDYSDPGKNRYAYLLEGFDQHWQSAEANNRFATYTNLDPGTYTLKIRGSNRLGEWSPHQQALQIEVLPHWYQTLTVKLIAALIAGLMLVFAYKWRIRQLMQREKLLQQEVDARTLVIKQKNRELEEASYRDQLTGLYNRRYIQHRISDDLDKVHRQYDDADADKADMIFLMVDIDYFKPVNDTYGHDAGDAILQQFAHELTKEFRDTDIVARWGGEEFLVIMRSTSRHLAREVAVRLKTRIEEFDFTTDEALVLRKTCSIGFVSYPFFPKIPRALSWKQTVTLADSALLLAKKTRNTYVGLEPGRLIYDAGVYGEIVRDPVAAYDKGLLRIDAQSDTEAKIING